MPTLLQYLIESIGNQNRSGKRQRYCQVVPESSTDDLGVGIGGEVKEGQGKQCLQSREDKVSFKNSIN